MQMRNCVWNVRFSSTTPRRLSTSFFSFDFSSVEYPLKCTLYFFSSDMIRANLNNQHSLS